MRRIALGALFLLCACSAATAPRASTKGQGKSADGGASGSFGDLGGDQGDDGTGSTQVEKTDPCDGSLAVDGDAVAFAKAIGICKGLVSATYANSVNGAGAPNPGQHGILQRFGNEVKPREGAALGVLSSGYAREFDGPNGATGMFKGPKQPMQPGLGSTNALPSGYPKSASGCPSQAGAKVFDVSVVKLELEVPQNAKGLAFDFDFWSGEWPEYVCTEYNDAFIALLDGENISFDAQNNPVSVNNGFFDRCTPNATTGCEGNVLKNAACPGGVGELVGTGFDAPGPWCNGAQSTGGGATGWLSSKAPVKPGAHVTLQFVIYDVGDPNFDSTVLIDNFRWIAEETTTGTSRPPPK